MEVSAKVEVKELKKLKELRDWPGKHVNHQIHKTQHHGVTGNELRIGASIPKIAVKSGFQVSELLQRIQG